MAALHPEARKLLESDALVHLRVTPERLGGSGPWASGG
jgi:hypothetical protein